MDLNTLWFILIAILYVGYFVLEGFDFGVGILLPFLGKNDNQRRVILNTIGPHWDGNEVWLITAGGATFAAFPGWYATLFSGYYIPLMLILLALILRNVAIEFRSLDDNPRWRSLFDWLVCIGSALPALLWGVAFASFVQGVPIDLNQNFAGNLFDIVTPYTVLGGLVSLFGFITHGAIFLSLKTIDPIMSQARRLAFRFWVPTAGLLAVFTISTYFFTDVIERLGINPGPIPIGAVAAFLAVGYFIRRKQEGWAFGMIALTVMLAISTIFLTLYPQVLVSTIDPAYSLTIYSTASGPVTLRTMTIVALIFTPIVLLYEGWSYWVFRKRVTGAPETLHY
ncbi:MAG TPA: cytochrome d ubiquinol oxidase subunit II [Anaerolineaceae bacterium]|nr:cytochrome d ubiquinol oxidase subunit II [Anaerolineaceae bacterium]